MNKRSTTHGLMFSTGFTSFSVLLFFPLQITFLSLCKVFDSISSNIDDILSINPSVNVFVFVDFNVHHKDWLTYSGGTNQPGKIIFISQMTLLLRRLTFLLGSQTVILIVPLLDCQNVFYNDFLSIMLLSQFPLTFHQIHDEMPCFTAQLMTILVLIGPIFVINLEMFHGRIYLNLVLLRLLVNSVCSG